MSAGREKKTEHTGPLRKTVLVRSARQSSTPVQNRFYCHYVRPKETANGQEHGFFLIFFSSETMVDQRAKCFSRPIVSTAGGLARAKFSRASSFSVAVNTYVPMHVQISIATTHVDRGHLRSSP